MRADRAALALIFVLTTLGVFLLLERNDNFFLRDDFETYHLCGYAEIARAWRAGEVPLLTPLSWQAGALAGEYQLAVFSPAITVPNLLLFSLDLPLPLIAAILVWLNSLILGFGTYVLARSKGLTPALATMAALAVSWSGWMLVWGVNWFPALASFAWIPWFWWALRRALERRDRWSVPLAGIFAALIFTTGWPFTCLMAFFLAALLTDERLRLEKHWRAVMPTAWSLLLGLGLSAPAWLMLIEYSSSTFRGQATRPLDFQTDMTVPTEALLGLVLPSVHAAWNYPWRPAGAQTTSVVMHIGLAPVAILVAGAFKLRSRLVRAYPHEFLILALLFLLAILPSLGMFRWSFRWLPLLFLQMVLLAGRTDMLLRRTTTPRYGATAVTLVSAVWAYVWWIDRGRGDLSFWFCCSVFLAATLWWIAETARPLSRLRGHLPALVVVVVTVLTAYFLLVNMPPRPRRHASQADPIFDPAVTYLALYQKERLKAPITVYGTRFFPGNEQMYSNLRFVNGYSPMGPAALTLSFGFDHIGVPDRMRPGLEPILRRMAVDGLVVWPDDEDPAPLSLEEFERAASTPDFEVYLRRSRPTRAVQTVAEALRIAWPEDIWQRQRSELPILERRGETAPGKVRFGSARLETVENERLRVTVDVDATGADRPVLVSFARPWFPGYRASVDGAAAEVMRLDSLMPAVEVPAGGTSRVTLRYLPWSLIVGLVLSAVSAAGVVFRLSVAVRSAPPRGKASAPA